MEIASPVLTSKWFEGSDYVQVIEMNVTNTHHQNYLPKADTLVVSTNSKYMDLVAPGNLTRLAPNQTTIIQIGVKNKAGVAAGSPYTMNIVTTYSQAYGDTQTATATSTGSCGLGDYEASSASLDNHGTPDWYNDAKLGIFIHWGI